MFWRRTTASLMLACVLAWPGLAGGAPSPPEQFDTSVASRLLNQVAQGFNTSNQGQVLAAFDAARMPNYAQFRDSVHALFAKYQSFRAAYRLRQSWPEGERAVVIAEFQVEGTPLEEGSPPLHRNAQLRFNLERGHAGWRIVDVAPRDFFS